jgi:hypothetical protein
MAKRVIPREAMLTCPDFSEPFTIHTDASHYPLGGVISQDGKPIAFHSRTLTDAQTCHTTTECELLSIVEMLKECRNIMVGHKIEVFTNHKNLANKHFNLEHVMRWCLILEEFGPTLTCAKGEHNVIADTLSWLELTEEEFSADAFAGDEEESPEDFPFSHSVIAQEQPNNPELMDRCSSGNLYDKTVCKHANKQCKLITQTIN